MTKLALVVGSLSVGGAERVAVELAVGAIARGIEADLVVAGESDGPRTDYEHSLKNEIEARGVPVFYVPFTLFDRTLRQRMRDHLVSRGTDLVHVHNRPQDWQLVALATFLGVPVFYSVHLNYPRGSRKAQALQVACGRSVPAVVCVSKTVADYAHRVEKIPRKKIHVIYNGIRTDVFRPLSVNEREKKRAELGWRSDDFIFICAARLADQKGHPSLLEGFARLPKEPRARLFIAGEGPKRAELEALIRDRGLSDRVTLLGARRDVPDLLGAADAYACASLQEGHPLALLEAMATELPVVAPRLPSIVEIAHAGVPILYGKEGDPSPEGHDPADVAWGLTDAMKHHAEHKQRARAAREHVASTYSLDAMNDQHAELYREILSKRRRPEIARRLAAAML
jgi:glycosyltransferase involved in cell wall biosynthesis